MNDAYLWIGLAMLLAYWVMSEAYDIRKTQNTKQEFRNVRRTIEEFEKAREAARSKK